MKSNYWLLIVFIFTLSCGTISKNITVSEKLKSEVADKVKEMKNLLGLNQSQVKQLKNIELRYLLTIEQINRDSSRDSNKRMDLLNEWRNSKLKECLSPDQYRKYMKIEKIKSYPLQAIKMS